MSAALKNRLPSAPERSEPMECAGSSACAITASAVDDEAAGKQLAPEMGNRKSSARDSGSARRGITQFPDYESYERAKVADQGYGMRTIYRGREDSV